MEEIALYPGVTVWPALSSPLSADTFFIRQGETVWVFDVGNDPRRARALNEIPGEKRVVLSHFHADHMGAMPLIEASEVYAGAFTCKKLRGPRRSPPRCRLGTSSFSPCRRATPKAAWRCNIRTCCCWATGPMPGKRGAAPRITPGSWGPCCRCCGVYPPPPAACPTARP